MIDTARSIWTAPPAPEPPEPSFQDGLLAGGVVLLAVLRIYAGEVTEGRFAAVLFAAALALLVPWRRQYPLATVAMAFVAMSAASVGALATGALGAVAEGSPAVRLILTYALVRWGSGHEASIGLALIVAAPVFRFLLGVALIVAAFPLITAHDPPPRPIGDVIRAAFWLLPAALGLALRYRADVRRERIAAARQRERERLARELHDTVAHHVSAIAIQAQAARALLPSRPEAAAGRLQTIEEAASRTLREMRTIVGALRGGEGAQVAPQQGLADIEQLAHEGQSGLRVEVAFSGTLGDLAPAVETGLYRLAQESIANVRRHSRRAETVRVKVEGEGPCVRLHVIDDGTSASASGAGAAAGFGLVGMEERARLLGGRLDAGPEPGGGWAVRAELPKTGHRA